MTRCRACLNVIFLVFAIVLPISTAFAAQQDQVLSSEEGPPDADGRIKSQKLVKRAGKYQYIRIEETLDGRKGKRAVASQVMVGDHVMVTVKGGVTAAEVDALAKKHGYGVRAHLGKTQTYLLSFTAKDHNDLPKAIADLSAEGIVRAAESDREAHVVGAPVLPNDPSFSDCWGLNNSGQSGGTADADIDAPEAWSLHTGSKNIKVAIIDTGVDYTHPDLAANIWQNPGESGAKATNGIDDDGDGYIDDVRGWDFCNNDNDPFDDFSHGTHCAGTIGAVGGNGVGVVGVCWSVSIVPLKFLNSSGTGFLSDAVLAVDYARSIGVDVMSNSWAGGGYDIALAAAIQAASDAGILFVAAAGNAANDNDVSPTYPASYDFPNVIAVGATTRTDELAGFSNYGAHSVHIAAPGQDVLSTIPGNQYAFYSGTSMATPHVAGACALIKSYTGASMSEIKARILDRSDQIAGLSNRITGGRRLNLNAALASLPTPWQHADIGAVGIAGDAFANGGPFIIQGSGGDIWNNADAFHFVYQPINGNCQIVARVASVQNTNVWAKAGVMFRESLNANSKHAVAVVTPSNGIVLQWRNATGGSSDYLPNGANAAPYWVKLVRSGSTFTGYKSADGATWVQIGSTTIAMANSFYVGLPVTSHDNALICTASIDNVTITQVVANQPPTVSLSTSAGPFTAPASITLTAAASDSDGAISKVDFYNGATLLFSDTASPYAYNWTGVGAGSYTLTAKATDNAGAETTSNAVAVTVNPPVAPGNGLTADYYDNRDFTGAKLTRIDPTVNFDWGLNAPDPSMGVETFSARWTGQVQAQFSETYTFFVTGDDGVRLWVNGALLVDKWIDQVPTEWSGAIALTAGSKYNIKLEYYENGGGASAILKWSSASTPKAVIPAVQLYPTTGNSAPTVTLSTNGTSFTAPASITLTAAASDSDGAIGKVDFYNGATLLFSDTASPYAYNWTGVGAGSYTLTAKATDNAGAETTSSVVNVTVSSPPTVNGLTGDYYDNSDFTGTKLTRIDPTVNFNWGLNAPDPSMGVDTYSARWTGQVQPQFTETYTFFVTGDDGVRLWVNGVLIVDKWIVQAPTEWSGTIALTAGIKYDIKLEYFENGGGAVAALSWSSPSTPKAIVPSSRLFTTSTAAMDAWMDESASIPISNG